MELINENDLQNVCGGRSCTEIASALAATGLVLLVCGTVVVSVLKGDIKIETIIRRPVVTTTQTTTTYTTYSY